MRLMVRSIGKGNLGEKILYYELCRVDTAIYKYIKKGQIKRKKSEIRRLKIEVVPPIVCDAGFNA